MPASLKDLRRRIKSVRNTEQITKAMKLVSAAKLGRAQNAVWQARPYTQELQRILEGFRSENLEHPFLSVHADAKLVVLLVLSSERGLCGSYNANVVRMALQKISEYQEKGYDLSILCIGKKAYSTLSRMLSGYQAKTVSLDDFTKGTSNLLEPRTLILLHDILEKQAFLQVYKLAHFLEQEYCKEKISKVVTIYTRFISMVSLVCETQQVLPVVFSHSAQEPNESQAYAFLEPTQTVVFEHLMERYVRGTLVLSFLEAWASEHAARMSAMENATRNAREMLRKLQITYQRARQAAITRELIEIISGAEAL